MSSLGLSGLRLRYGRLVYHTLYCRPCRQFSDVDGTVLRHNLFWSLPHFTDFSIRSSFILFAFTAYNASAWARSLGWCGVYTSLLALRRKRLYTPRGAARFLFPPLKRFPSLIPNTVPRSSDFQPISPLDQDTREQIIFSFWLSYSHQLMITRLNNIGSSGGSGSMDHKKVRTQNSIHDGWTGFLSWLAVSQIFRVNGGGVVFCSFWYGGLT